jgi:hypothetical protein
MVGRMVASVSRPPLVISPLLFILSTMSAVIFRLDWPSDICSRFAWSWLFILNKNGCVRKMLGSLLFTHS